MDRPCRQVVERACSLTPNIASHLHRSERSSERASLPNLWAFRGQPNCSAACQLEPQFCVRYPLVLRNVILPLRSGGWENETTGDGASAIRTWICVRLLVRPTDRPTSRSLVIWTENRPSGDAKLSTLCLPAWERGYEKYVRVRDRHTPMQVRTYMLRMPAIKDSRSSLEHVGTSIPVHLFSMTLNKIYNTPECFRKGNGMA